MHLAVQVLVELFDHGDLLLRLCKRGMTERLAGDFTSLNVTHTNDKVPENTNIGRILGERSLISLFSEILGEEEVKMQASHDGHPAGSAWQKLTLSL